MSLRPRRHVISETIDGEVITIDLTTGVYYSLSGTAGELWAELEGGTSPHHLSALLVTRYEVAEPQARLEVETFLDELRQDDLIEDAPDDTPPGPRHPVIADKAVFVAPVVERYTDMAHVLLLDPVHDVDEAVGWPKAR